MSTGQYIDRIHINRSVYQQVSILTGYILQKSALQTYRLTGTGINQFNTEHEG